MLANMFWDVHSIAQHCEDMIREIESKSNDLDEVHRNKLSDELHNHIEHIIREATSCKEIYRIIGHMEYD